MQVVLEEDRHWWFATRTRSILVFLDRYLGPGKGRRVLDVGCGAANMTHHLSHYGDVIGVDNNLRPLEIARQRGLDAREGSADQLPFGPEEFDLVALLDTIEHVADEAAVLEECRRVLRKPGREADQRGGLLLVTVPAFMWLWSHNDVINRHQRRYTAGELRQRLAEHGFEVLRISYSNFIVFPLAAALILLRRGRAEPELASPHCDEDAYQVEMEPAPGPLNAMLSLIGRLEIALQRGVNLPWGTSLIAIARRES
jgi:ubiquinone/menaquinone biosynthesis C-methylase UbiE